MEVGIVGLGRMGANMALRLVRHGHGVRATDLAAGAREEAEQNGVHTHPTLASLVTALDTPRVLWLMLPAGEATEGVLVEALPQLEPGDIVVDGANSHWQDSRRRAALARERGVEFVDCGVSGGVWGLDSGFNLMVGGTPAAFRALEPLLESLAPAGGYLHVGPAGTGHFVKMVHNGIEYGLMQAYGEGFAALESFPEEIDLPAVARLWNEGSVIRSWLLELTAQALHDDPQLEAVTGYVNDSGMGRWTVEYAVQNAVPMPAITQALFARFASREEDPFSARLAASLRNRFGGHALKERTASEPE